MVCKPVAVHYDIVIRRVAVMALRWQAHRYESAAMNCVDAVYITVRA